MQFVFEILLVIIISGTPLYFFFDFGVITFGGILLASGTWILLSVKTLRRHLISSGNVGGRQPETLGKFPVGNYAVPDKSRCRRLRVLAILFILICGVSVFILSASAVTHSITGPWEAIPPIFFSVYFLQSLLLITGLIAGVPRLFAIIGITLHSIVSLAVIPLIYPLGYGFDPVIHGQAEKIIAETGTLTPKTIYYTGQYVLLVFLANITRLPLEMLDRLLLPLIAAIALPFSAMRSCRAIIPSEQFAGIAALAFSMAVIPTIASPTPWGWSVFLFSLFILASIEFFCLPDKGRRVTHLGMLSLAGFFIHPIAGLPLLASTMLCACIHYGKKFRLAIGGVLVGIGGLLVPLAFLVNASGQAVFAFNESLPALHMPKLPWRFDALRDPLYALAMLLPWIAAGAWIFGAFKLFQTHRRFVLAHAGVAAMMIVSFCVMRFFLSFPFLIDYEQASYANRFVTLLSIAVLPLTLAGIEPFFKKLMQGAGSHIRMIAAVLLAALLTGAIYLAYPRNDPYESSHGYNISDADMEAVARINGDAGNDAYLVLANQVSSAAAIKTFGFQVRYPVPTGSPLYQTYLSFLARPDRSIIDEEMKKAKVKRAYFIIHEYEPRAPNIAKTTRAFADASFSLESKGAWVFGFIDAPKNSGEARRSTDR